MQEEKREVKNNCKAWRVYLGIKEITKSVLNFIFIHYSVNMFSLEI